MKSIVWPARRLAALLLLLPMDVHAEQEAGVGNTNWALPGINRVGVPAAGQRRLALAGSAGYGLTEAQSSADGTHHRLMGTAAVAVAPTPELELALRLDGRYDRHPDDGSGTHGGAVGEPRLLVRYGSAVHDLRVGGEVGVWVPGESAPSLAFDATTVDAKVLGAYSPSSGFVAGLMAGFRFDNSGNAVENPARLRPGDRLAIGLSDFNAVLVGVGVAVPVGGTTQILAEVSGDLLVGSSAPSLSESPLRGDVGIRQGLTRALALELLAELSASARPTLGPNEPLVPVEPRVALLAGIRYTLPFDTAPVESVRATPDKGSPAIPQSEPEAKPTSVVIRVTDENGRAVENAIVQVRIGEFSGTATGSGGGLYRVDNAPAGDATITISMEKFVSKQTRVRVGAPGAQPVEVRLQAVPPSGQLRGLVRSFSGRGLPASIRVEPIGVEATADAEGAFTLDVPPGDYEVVLRLEGYKEQRRKVHVDDNGVTVLNAELFEAR